MRSDDIAVSLQGIAKNFGASHAVRPLDLEIRAGDFLAILGPSGCGKTTLLRMIGGFVEPSAGSVHVGGADVTHEAPERRPTNMVFQGYGLFPHMTVRQNIGYGLKLKDLVKSDIGARVDRMLELVRLGALADRMPSELSGGQQQRVAVARALVMEPPVLLLDEPFSALDLKLRQTMQEELRRIHKEVGGTFVFVTHDQGEALALANRIAVMNEGRLEQVGTPEDIYLRPASLFVARFIGEANVLKAMQASGYIDLVAGSAFPWKGEEGPVAVVVRPENVVLGRGEAGAIMVEGHVEDVTFLGSHVRYTLVLKSQERFLLNAAVADHALNTGQPATASWRLEQTVVLRN